MKNTRHTVRSMQGKEVDFEKLRLANALEPAVGNVRVNTRGDEIGPNGEIIRKREEIVNDYYKTKDYVSISWKLLDCLLQDIPKMPNN